MSRGSSALPHPFLFLCCFYKCLAEHCASWLSLIAVSSFKSLQEGLRGLAGLLQEGGTSQLGSKGHSHSRRSYSSTDLQYLHPNRSDAHFYWTEAADCRLPLLRHCKCNQKTSDKGFHIDNRADSFIYPEYRLEMHLTRKKKGYQLYVILAMKGTATPSTVGNCKSAFPICALEKSNSYTPWQNRSTSNKANTPFAFDFLSSVTLSGTFLTNRTVSPPLGQLLR